MAGFLLYFALALLLLALLDWFPPTSLLVRPLIQAGFKFFGGFITGAWRYFVIFVKAIVADHLSIVRHLTHKRIDMDARERMEYENDKRR